MTTKFFNNTDENTLFSKFSGIAAGMGEAFHSFLAVSGFFRSSGYFKLRGELGAVQKIKILVGINIDNIFRRHDQTNFWFGDAGAAKREYTNDFIEDIRNAAYSAEIENGILQFIEDVKSGRLEMRVHKAKTLHAKFFLCLPENHNEHSDGWVIMGSSNLTDAGLGITRAPQYELNVAMKDYGDVAYCKAEFERLWNEAVPLTEDDIAKPIERTHLGIQPTPFELYMKVLIETFGEQIEDDFSLEIPDEFKDLSYQRDAVIQGYQMLCQHNGFFLSDVVGLGKTVVAAMIAKRFVESNGRQTKILVVYPPAVKANWKETMKKFALKRHTQFVSNGSLSKVINGEEHYHEKEDFDLIIVDESHNFRHTNNTRFSELQNICKAPRRNHGNFGATCGPRKRVMLLSATAVNNEPDDLRNQILLFQDAGRPTLTNVPNINSFFAPRVARFKEMMRLRNDPDQFDPKKIDEIYAEIRREILQQITVRRTRQNILNDPDYKADLKKNGVIFPKISTPEILKYKLEPTLEQLFFRTLWQLTGDEKYKQTGTGGEIHYARYRAVEFLNPDKKERYEKADQIAKELQGIYRTLMIKRLESSFHAFKKSLKNAHQGVEQMLQMFAEDKVLIAPEFDVGAILDKDSSIDGAIEKILEKSEMQKEDFVYKASDFNSKFQQMLREDKEIFETLISEWENVTDDPKLEEFIRAIKNQLLDAKQNPSKKLVIFSESLDTAVYLKEKLQIRLDRNDILAVHSDNRNRLEKTIRSSFDANLPPEEQDGTDNILITTDVLAEGINLHRANTVVHYDTPWNVSRMMQRIGRVNRIGSTASVIRNVVFYPSDQGDKEISLYANALIKMQGFQSALGEDVQIFSNEEIVKQFKLFDREIKDDTDETLILLREAREFFNKHRDDYERVKKFPLKVRCLRDQSFLKNGTAPLSVAFIKTRDRREFYKITGAIPTSLSFLEAIGLLRAKCDEKALPFAPPASETHYADVVTATRKFNEVHIEKSNGNDPAANSHTKSKNRAILTATTTLRACARYANTNSIPKELLNKISELQNDLNIGIHTTLPAKLNKAVKDAKFGELGATPTPEQIEKLPEIITSLYNEFGTRRNDTAANDTDTADATIVIAETFI